jgi:hypothetical protein
MRGNCLDAWARMTTRYQQTFVTTVILEGSAGPDSRCIDISVIGVKFAVNLEGDVTL